VSSQGEGVSSQGEGVSPQGDSSLSWQQEQESSAGSSQHSLTWKLCVQSQYPKAGCSKSTRAAIPKRKMEAMRRRVTISLNDAG